MLRGLQEEIDFGGSVLDYAAAIKYNRKTIYNWRKRSAEDRLEDRKPIPNNIPHKTDEATKQKVIELYEQHKRRYGCRTLCQIISGVRAGTVNRIIKAYKKEKAKRYEFPDPNVCWSGDICHIRGRESKLLMWQDEASRYKLCWDLGKQVNAKVVKMVLEKAFTQYEVPLVIKHDNGPMFIAAEVQDFLKANGVIALASPPYYAMYNGKMERGLKEIRGWIQDIESKATASHNEIYQGIAQAVYEENEIRPRLIFNGKTSREIYYYKERFKIDRIEFRTEIEELEQKLLNKLSGSQKGGDYIKRLAKRLAIETVLLKKSLCYYTNYDMVNMTSIKTESVKTLSGQNV